MACCTEVLKHPLRALSSCPGQYSQVLPFSAQPQTCTLRLRCGTLSCSCRQSSPRRHRCQAGLSFPLASTPDSRVDEVPEPLFVWYIAQVRRVALVPSRYRFCRDTYMFGHRLPCSLHGQARSAVQRSGPRGGIGLACHGCRRTSEAAERILHEFIQHQVWQVRRSAAVCHRWVTHGPVQPARDTPSSAPLTGNETANCYVGR